MADRDTYLIELKPKAAGRPSRKIWVDVEAGVILKMEHYDSQKRLGQLFVYSEINYKPEIDEGAFRERQRTGETREARGEGGREEFWNHNQGKLDLDKLRKEAQLNVILPDQAPAGFILQSAHIIKFDRLRNVRSERNG